MIHPTTREVKYETVVKVNIMSISAENKSNILEKWVYGKNYIW